MLHGFLLSDRINVFLLLSAADFFFPCQSTENVQTVLTKVPPSVCYTSARGIPKKQTGPLTDIHLHGDKRRGH